MATNVLTKYTWGRRVWMITILFSIISTFGTIALNVINAIRYGLQTNDWKLLADITMGEFLSADEKILISISELNIPDITVNYANYLKTQIMVSVIMQFVLLGLLAFIVIGLYFILSSEASRNIILTIFMIFLVLILWYGLQVGYKTYYLGTAGIDSLNVFQGVRAIIQNWDLIFNNVQYSTFEVVNGTVTKNLYNS